MVCLFINYASYKKLFRARQGIEIGLLFFTFAGAVVEFFVLTGAEVIRPLIRGDAGGAVFLVLMRVVFMPADRFGRTGVVI